MLRPPVLLPSLVFGRGMYDVIMGELLFAEVYLGGGAVVRCSEGVG